MIYIRVKNTTQHEDNEEKQKTLQVDSIFGKGANKPGHTPVIDQHMSLTGCPEVSFNITSTVHRLLPSGDMLSLYTLKILYHIMSSNTNQP